MMIKKNIQHSEQKFKEISGLYSKLDNMATSELVEGIIWEVLRGNKLKEAEQQEREHNYRMIRIGLL